MSNLAAAPSALNTFIPNWEASGKLMTGFSRNPDSFPLMKYTQFVQSPKIRGYYLKLTNQSQARVLSADQNVWPDNNPRPVRKELETFLHVQFTCMRRTESYGLGDLAKEMADFDILEIERRAAAQRLMTARVMRQIAVITSATPYGVAADPDLSAAHTDTATNVGGGKWDVSAVATPYIRRSCNAIMKLINLDTNGALNQKDYQPKMYMVMSPTTAALISKSPEILDFIKGSVHTWDSILGNLHENAKYGLPKELFGFEIVVDDTVKITSKPGDTLVRAEAFPANTVLFTSKVGGVTGSYGGPSFSTSTIFGVEDMTVEEQSDQWNRITGGGVTENVAHAVTCAASGYLLTAVTA